MKPWWPSRLDRNLPQVWKAITALPMEGQQIVPAKVGAIKPLKAVKVHEFMKLLQRRA